MRRLWIALLCALLLVSGVSAQDNNVLRVATTAAITTWDPSMSFSTEALYMANIYEPLLWVNPAGADTEFTPALATSWDKSDDGLTWTFHLREGVKFHDGETLTADAVKRSIERAQAVGGAAFIWAPLDTIETPDDLTVVFHLKYAAPVDLIASSLYGAWIVSPKALDAVDADSTYFEAGKEAGTGPYMLTDYTPDSEVVLSAFPDYWGGWDDATHYNIVDVNITADENVRLQLLTDGETDLSFALPATSYQSFVDNPDFNVYTGTTFFNYTGFLNVTRPPLDNKQVRQAIAYAIPYDDLILVGVDGRGTQSHGPVPEGVFPYSPDVPQYHQDLDKARELLKEAGHEGGGFTLNMTYASENNIEEKIAPLIADALGQIGITVNIQPILFNQQWEEAKADPANAQDIFLLLYWPTYSDAGSDNLWSMFHSSETPFFNLSYYNNPDYDKLIDDAITLAGTDRAGAQKLYDQAMNILVDDSPALFLMDVGVWNAVPKTVEGFEYNPNYAFAYFFYPLHKAA